MHFSKPSLNLPPIRPSMPRFRSCRPRARSPTGCGLPARASHAASGHAPSSFPVRTGPRPHEVAPQQRERADHVRTSSNVAGAMHEEVGEGVAVHRHLRPLRYRPWISPSLAPIARVNSKWAPVSTRVSKPARLDRDLVYRIEAGAVGIDSVARYASDVYSLTEPARGTSARPCPS